MTRAQRINEEVMALEVAQKVEEEEGAQAKCLEIISSVPDPALPLNLSESTVQATPDCKPVEIPITMLLQSQEK